MKRQLLALSRRYQAALQKHLQPGKTARVPVREPGQAVPLGVAAPDIARMHKKALTTAARPGGPPAKQERTVKRAEVFLHEAAAPIAKSLRARRESKARLSRRNKVLTQRSAQLRALNRRLQQGIMRRKAAEGALRESGKRRAKSLRESNQLQKQLRHLTHRLLSAQEAEKKKISHELQDGVAQTLLGINVRLLTLKKAARGNAAKLRKEIASTQRVVEESVQSINRFAHELDVHKPA